MRPRIVYAYSGAAEAWAAIAAHAAARGAEIVTLTLDLGQGADLEEVRDRARAGGALRAHVLDAREEFARDYVLPALHAGALGDGRDPMAAPLSRPIIAAKLAEIAAIEQAEDAADLSGMPANLWGRTGGAFTLTRPPAAASDAPAEVEIAFERGVPTAVNGVSMALTELIEILTIIAGSHGVGRITPGSGIRDPGSGVAARSSSDPGSRIPDPAIIEAPAAVVLHTAHQALETAVSSPALAALKRELAPVYAALIRSGEWQTPLREALDAFNARIQQQVTGAVRITLLKGDCTVTTIDPHPGSPIPDPGSPIPAPGSPIPAPGSRTTVSPS